MNKQVNAGEKENGKPGLAGWTQGSTGPGQRLRRIGEGGRRETAGYCVCTPGTGRYSNTFSYSHTDTQGATLLPTAAQTGASEGSPFFSCGPGCGSWSLPYTSVHLTSLPAARPFCGLILHDISCSSWSRPQTATTLSCGSRKELKLSD